MKKILFLFILLTSIKLHSQECVFDINKTSKVTGEKILLTQSKSIGQSDRKEYQLSTSFIYADSKYMLCIDLQIPNKEVTIAEQAGLLITLNNKKLIMIRCDENYRTTPIKTKGKRGKVYSLRPFYNISEEDLKSIKEEGISNIKMNTSLMVYHCNTNKEDNLTIHKLITCLLSNI